MMAKVRVHIFGHADVESAIRILDHVHLVHWSLARGRGLPVFTNEPRLGAGLGFEPRTFRL